MDLSTLWAVVTLLLFLDGVDIAYGNGFCQVKLVKRSDGTLGFERSGDGCDEGTKAVDEIFAQIKRNVMMKAATTHPPVEETTSSFDSSPLTHAMSETTFELLRTSGSEITATDSDFTSISPQEVRESTATTIGSDYSTPALEEDYTTPIQKLAITTEKPFESTFIELEETTAVVQSTGGVTTDSGWLEVSGDSASGSNEISNGITAGENEIDMNSSTTFHGDVTTDSGWLEVSGDGASGSNEIANGITTEQNEIDMNLSTTFHGTVTTDSGWLEASGGSASGSNEITNGITTQQNEIDMNSSTTFHDSASTSSGWSEASGDGGCSSGNGIDGITTQQNELGLDSITSLNDSFSCEVIHCGICFWSVIEHADFSRAEQHCVSHGAAVANIYSQHHFELMVDNIRNKVPMYWGGFIWTGMKFNIRSGTVELRNGEEAPFVKWMHGQPNTNEMRIGIDLQIITENSNASGMWNWFHSAHDDGFICER